MIEEQKIAELKEMIILQASNIESMLTNCIDGLLNQDKEKLKNVIDIEEKKINKKEIEIDKFYTDFLALYNPEAKDLRTILMITKMNIDLERIGDHCVNIAESALYLIKKPKVKPFIDIPRMAEIAQKMIKDSIDSFLNENIDTALKVCKKDNKVDQINEQVFRELITYMISDPKTIERSLHLLRIANNIEKIADLATNICEEAIYVISGKDIKHKKLEKIKKIKENME